MATSTMAPPAGADDMLRFAAGARNRDDGVFYDETTTLGAGSKTPKDIEIPPGNWLTEVFLLIEVVTAGNSAAVALQSDAPWSILELLELTDPGGNAISSWTGYGLFLTNLLGGFDFQTDPTASPSFVAMTTGSGATGGSATLVLKVPVQIIDRDAIGAMANGPSNTTPRIRYRLAPSAAVYSTAPTALPTVRVRAISSGWVLPAADSIGGRPIMPEPPGGRTFQQWSELTYDFSTGKRTIRHTRTGQTYRTLLLVARDNTGVRSNSVLSELAFSVDGIALQKGLWAYHRHCTWKRQLLAAANLPAGVIQISLAHEWDGKVGGEMRDQYIVTAPGTDVSVELTSGAAGQLQIITNEVVSPAGSGVVRV